VSRGEKKATPSPPIGHGVEKAVAGCGEKQIAPQSSEADARDALAEERSNDDRDEESGEKKGMRESAMAPKVSVANAEAEADDVEIGNDRTSSADREDAFRCARPPKASADRERCDGMGKEGRHLVITMRAEKTSYTGRRRRRGARSEKGQEISHRFPLTKILTRMDLSV